MTKILLVEDDKALREIYGVRLLAEGYDIVSASDGEEALTTAMNEQPDLIISDVMMPKISGFEMLDLLRTNAKTRDIKVIVMSALGGEAQRQRGEQLGADRYLVKSQVGIEDVVTTVREVLNEIKQKVEQAPMPTATQSPFNPIQSTAPNVAAAVVAPNLPSIPQPIPTIMIPVTAPIEASTNSQFAAAPVPAEPIQPQNEKPLLPQKDPSIQSLPPIPAPIAISAPLTTSNTAPVPNNISQVSAPSASAAVGSARVIAPTGETLNPRVDIDSLLAKEEATIIAPEFGDALVQSSQTTVAAPATPVQFTVSAGEQTVPGIQVSENGMINLDSIPQQTPGTNGIFPTN